MSADTANKTTNTATYAADTCTNVIADANAVTNTADAIGIIRCMCVAPTRPLGTSRTHQGHQPYNFR